MASVQERLQMKREPLDKWSVREKLCLASAVSRSGDQNWMSVSRALKPFGEPNRPTDWFHQKNCAAQYGALLGNVETPKRKKRTSNVDSGIDTPTENILRRLLTERQAELKKLLAEEKAEYLKLQDDMVLLQSGKVTEEQLDKWCKEIDEEEHRREQEAFAQTQFLKERELRKQEVERAWRPIKPTSVIGQKRKNSDPVESLLESEHSEELQQQQQQTHIQSQESVKPALSPLLTTITNRHVPNSNTNPMIASLLNSSTGVTVSPGLQQLVSTAIGQEAGNIIIDEQQQPLGNDILDDANLPNIKIEDLANSILVQDGPLPEIKKEEVDDIISEIIENAHDIVTDPEQHLQLDGNGDININLELDDFEDEEIPEVPQPKVTEPLKEIPKIAEKTVAPPIIDPFEFQEDPVIFEPTVKASVSSGKQDPKQYIPHYQQQPPPQIHQFPLDVDKIVEVKVESEIKEETDIKKEMISEERPKVEKSTVPGSVEIVEVVVMDDEDIDKELNKSQIQNIVHSTKSNDSEDIKSEKVEAEEEKSRTEVEEGSAPESKDTATFEESSEASDTTVDTKKDIDISLNVQESLETTTITPNFSEELYDDISMEVKVDKTGKVKRDYSRTKKKEGILYSVVYSFDMLLAIEKAQLEDSELTEETFSDNTTDTEKKDTKTKVKSENERSNSPWTEEEDNANRCKRRYSTPATPVDSVPNSPASSTAYYDDDRDYRNWKKSVMLVYNRLATNKYASLFLKPITEDQAPGYSSIVYRPMDLQTIKKNIENGTIRTTLEFKRDTMLMFMNAIMYNKTNDHVYNMAYQMQQESIQPIEILMQAQNQADTPQRRETRTSESSCKRKRLTTDETIIKSKKRKED
ncbi:hypothetical protein NQ314_018569 [Rhamnusium bicolor]|uniref:Bromo domain-containing protein n=1 Tax=Rhamnusium bicolor TaxID=1586634 RepID=A0AAV8WR28_9CUCU|nr:hypothetical protein NQ314_018569 [Rhamnusium bicolor]